MCVCVNVHLIGPAICHTLKGAPIYIHETEETVPYIHHTNRDLSDKRQKSEMVVINGYLHLFNKSVSAMESLDMIPILEWNQLGSIITLSYGQICVCVCV